MREETRSQEEPRSAEQVNRRRRGCILKLLAFWFGLLGLIIWTMYFVRSRADRDPENVLRHAAELVDLQLEEGFYPYSSNYFLGVRLISFWNEQHLSDEGYTTSVIAVYRDDKWRNLSLEEVRNQVLPKLETKLDRVEFRVREQAEERLSNEGETAVIHRFSGIQLLGEEYLEATTCYRFMMSSQGPIQVHTMGLERNFPAARQMAILAAVKPR